MQKSILITGCSSGIGLATCQYLKERGYLVFATARNENDVDRLRKEGFDSFQLDVTQSEQIINVVNAIQKQTDGKLYALCNNAGYAIPGALEDIDRDSLRKQFETNVFGLQELTNTVLPIFRKQGFGRIIHISSVLGIISLPFRGAYNASKYAVEGLADTLRLELRNTAIRVSLIEPGPIRTQFRKNALSAFNQHVHSEVSVYRQAYFNFLNMFQKNENKFVLDKSPEAVAKKIYKALESSNPKPRYYVTFPTYLFATLKRILPVRLLDLILAKIANQEIN